MNVIQTSHCRRHQPRETEARVHKDHQAYDDRVVVIRLPVLEFVTGMIDQMPRNPVVEEHEYEGEKRWPGGHERDPRLAVQVAEVDHPGAIPVRRDLALAVRREVRVARDVAALERWREVRGDVQLLDRDLVEGVPDQAPDQDRDDHCEVSDHIAERLVGEERAELELSQLEGQRGRPEEDYDAEEGACPVRVVVLVLVGVVRLVGEIEVMDHPHGRKRRPNGVDDEDQGDEEGEDPGEEYEGCEFSRGVASGASGDPPSSTAENSLVREARAEDDDAIQVDDRRDHHVGRDPNSDPLGRLRGGF